MVYETLKSLFFTTWKARIEGLETARKSTGKEERH